MPASRFAPTSRRVAGSCGKARSVRFRESDRRVAPRVSWVASGRGALAARGFAIVLALVGTSPAQAAESYAIAMHGAPALPADFTHMPYANPDARKGGRLTWGILGTFDSLNPL